MDFPGGLDRKGSACNARNLGLIPESQRFPGEGNGYPLQYSCLENPMDRGGWRATVHGVAKSWTWLSDWYFHFHMFVHACVLSRFSHGTSSRFRASLVAQLVKNPSAMWETWVWFLGWEDPPEKGMAAHVSILAWRIPWTEKPGGLQFTVLQRVGHDWVTDTFTFTTF